MKCVPREIGFLSRVSKYCFFGFPNLNIPPSRTSRGMRAPWTVQHSRAVIHISSIGRPIHRGKYHDTMGQHVDPHRDTLHHR